MHLTQDQLFDFEENGFLVLPELFQPKEVNEINDASREIFSETNPANIIESKSGEVRTAMGLHLRHKLFGDLVRDPRLSEPAYQLRGEKLYVQQVKINVKAAFEGEQWQWHYDFATHHNDDGVPEPLALNLHIFLDDVNHFNGPLYFIPGSHKKGPAPTWHDKSSTSYPLWVVYKDRIPRSYQIPYTRKVHEQLEGVEGEAEQGKYMIIGKKKSLEGGSGEEGGGEESAGGYTIGGDISIYEWTHDSVMQPKE